jgi:hypothetical protein
MKSKLLILILIINIFVACTSTLQPIREDGIYKQFKDDSFQYYKFKKNRYYSTTCNECTDEEAIKKLNIKVLNKQSAGYINKKSEIKTYWQTNSLHYNGFIRKNKNGHIKNSIFLKMQNNKIIKKIDYRIINKLFILNTNGEKINKNYFEDIYIYNKQYARVKRDNRYGIYDVVNKKLIREIKYTWIKKDISNNFVAFNLNSKIGFFDKNFNIVIKAKFHDVLEWVGDDFIHSIPFFIDNVQAVKLKNTNWFFINKLGQRISTEEFKQIYEYKSKELIPVKRNNIRYYYNLKTNKFNNLKSYRSYTNKFSNSIIHIIGKDTKIITDLKGNLLLKYSFQDIQHTYINNTNQFFIVKVNNKYGVLNNSGNIIIPIKYDDISIMTNNDYNHTAFIVKIGTYKDKEKAKYGMLDIHGNIVIPIKYEVIEKIKKNLYLLINNKYSDLKTTYLFDYKLKKIIFTADKIDIIDYNTKEKNKYLRIVKNKKEGLIDFQGNVILEASRDYISNVKHDMIIGYPYGRISNLKNEVLKEYDGMIKALPDNYVVYNSSKISLYNYSHKKLITMPAKGNGMPYVCIWNKNKGYLIIQNNDKYGIIDTDGKIIFKQIYKKIECNNLKYNSYLHKLFIAEVN